MRIPFFEPAYNSRSYDFEAQRCINFYPEVDDGAGSNKVVLYGTPGTTPSFQTPNGAPVRSWHVFNGIQYFVAGSGFYARTFGGSITLVGTLNTASGRVVMENNGLKSNGIGGNQIIIVDGANCYIYDAVSGFFTVITEHLAQQATATLNMTPAAMSSVTVVAGGAYLVSSVDAYSYTSDIIAAVSDSTGTGANLSVQVGFAISGITIVGPYPIAYSPVVTITDPTGNGATATAIVDGSHQLTGVTITGQGSGYTNPKITVSNVSFQPSCFFSTDYTNAKVVHVRINSGGSNYTAPTITFTNPTILGGGAAATAHVTQQITSITVNNGGSGYIAPPIVSIEGMASQPIIPTAISGSGTVVTVTAANHGITTGTEISASGSSTAGYNATGVVATSLSSSQFSYPGTGTGTPTTMPTITNLAAGTVSTSVTVVDSTITAISITAGGSGYNGTPTITISAPEGSAPPANPQSVSFIDGYFIVSAKDSMNVYASELYNGKLWNPLAFAAVEASQDNVQAVVNLGQQLFIMKQYTSELWSDVAIPTSQGFPFQRIAGAVLDFGTSSRDSITTTKAGGAVFCIGQVKVNGVPQFAGIFEISGLTPRSVAPQGIIYRIQQFPTVEDAFAFVQYDAGHVFVWFTFPSGDATFVYDMATQMWHERSSAVSLPHVGRHIADSYCYFGGLHHVSDALTGDVYLLSEEYRSDCGNPIVSVRRAPVIMDEGGMDLAAINRVRFDCMTGVGTTAPAHPASGHAIVMDGAVTAVVVDDQGSDYTSPPVVAVVGEGTGAVLTPVMDKGRVLSITVENGGSGYIVPNIRFAGPVVSPSAALSWSDDGGKTWGNEYLRPLGDEGQYNTLLEYRRLGVVRKGRIFQLSVSDPVKKVFRSVMVNR